MENNIIGECTDHLGIDNISINLLTIISQEQELQKEFDVRTCPIPHQLGNTNYYSQTVEDYILSIVFDDIDKGTYIDVGASDPNHISVTKYFYLNGWRGINIEPLPNQYKKLLEHRPEDINLNFAIADKEGVMNLNMLQCDPFSTFDQHLADMWKERGNIIKTIPVNMKTLDSVLQEYPMGTIHFLKIDVEGYEREVLLSINLNKHRPWVILIEAIEPGTCLPTEYKWKEILESNNYEFILSDPLNSYYVAIEHFKQLYGKFLSCYNCIKSFGNVMPNIKFRGGYSV